MFGCVLLLLLLLTGLSSSSDYSSRPGFGFCLLILRDGFLSSLGLVSKAFCTNSNGAKALACPFRHNRQEKDDLVVPPCRVELAELETPAGTSGPWRRVWCQDKRSLCFPNSNLMGRVGKLPVLGEGVCVCGGGEINIYLSKLRQVAEILNCPENWPVLLCVLCEGTRWKAFGQFKL